MFKRLLLLSFMLFAVNAYAEIYSCKKPTGETEFSDTPCKAGSSSELVPDRDYLTPEQEMSAQRKLEQQKVEANEAAARRSASVSQPSSTTEGTALKQEVPPEDAYVGAGCNDLRGPRSNCADDLYKKQLPPVQPRSRPIPRAVPR